MKIFLLLFTVTFSILDDDIKEINTILASNHFSITIEKLDVGYIQNKQIYYIDKASNQVYITHKAMYTNEQDSTLNSTKIDLKVLENLAQYFIQLKTFQIHHKSEHDKLFNTTNTHQFITLKSNNHSVLISDVKKESFKKISDIIVANRN
ncbi:MAG TPA: hypothetical protein EYG85_11305 [Crocinitomix sp.]|nr:hypothetical protein [Crocinitomix sp.]